MPNNRKSNSLAKVLDSMTTEGDSTLTEHLQNNDLRCYACGHKCLIKEGRRGICKVRYNEGGQLRVPFNYVAALQCDPTEKKPFFHALPGSDTLTFGMLGCDLHCSYCFTGDTKVVTSKGPTAFEKLFESAERIDEAPGAHIAYPNDLYVIAASGDLKKVQAVFKHQYSGDLSVIRPYYLPALRCTPDHKIYATDNVSIEPKPIQAKKLTSNHYLAIPRHYSFSSLQTVDVTKQLRNHLITYKVPWKLSVEDRDFISTATTNGQTSRQIGAKLGKSASYIRHVRRKISLGRSQDSRSSGPIVENDRVRFPNEHRPGISASMLLNENLAKLLGYYCAEGSICRDKNRPNSYSLNFSFSLLEDNLIDQVCSLIKHCFGINSSCIKRQTTSAVVLNKASVALLFKSLAGGRGAEKRVPEILFDAHRPIVQAFINAYVEGDGHKYSNGKVSVTTISKDLAYGIAWLALKLGYLPSIYDSPMSEEGYIQNRRIKRAPNQFTVVWYEDPSVKRKVVKTDKYYLVPIRSLGSEGYEGSVYNMEVEEEHNYLAGFFLVSNCQNWLTSQALRDETAGVDPRFVTADRLVTLALAQGASIVGSSYNEPLITAEWAIEVFKKAKAAGLKTAFISNGNATPQVLDYLRPWTDCYKIDLKSMSDRNYRKLGGVVDNILETVRMVYEREFWEEIVTLVIPGFNDSDDELKAAADFIASVSPDIPWHVTAFHQDYRMMENDNTSVETLIRACEIGKAAGLRYIYAGNLPGRVGPWENTYCPSCGDLLIERYGYIIKQQNVTNEGKCPSCSSVIPGIWS